MAQKRHRVDQMISKLRRADVELGKGKKVPEACKLIGIAEQTYDRWRQATGDGEGVQNPAERECPAEEDGGQAGSRCGDFEGSREGKLVSSETRR